MTTPSIGRLVHYVGGESHLPLLITDVSADEPYEASGYAFGDPRSFWNGPMWVENVPYDPDKGNHSWHWSEQAP